MREKRIDDENLTCAIEGADAGPYQGFGKGEAVGGRHSDCGLVRMLQHVMGELLNVRCRLRSNRRDERGLGPWAQSCHEARDGRW